MTQQGLLILVAYFTLLAVLVRLCHRKVQSEKEFILGNRSLSFWLTALSAHASDMSAWLFLGYPALVFEGGVFAAWAAIGLIAGMFLNWQFVAARLRKATERLGSLTLSSYFEARLQDTSGRVRLISSVMSIFFFTCYVASGLAALGVLAEALLGLSPVAGSLAGLAFVVGYVLFGGYRTVAWIDLFQGFFLLGVIFFIPAYVLYHMGGFSILFSQVEAGQRTASLFPNTDFKTFWQLILMAAGWGLGYFGQPQILTKFMGIADVKKMSQAKYLGMGWQGITLGCATFIGLIGIVLFPQGVADTQYVILDIVKMVCPLWIAGLVLCAVVAATTNVMAAHLLVVASNLSEDIYKTWIHPTASSARLLLISRAGVILVASVACAVALCQFSSVYYIVLYAWSGLGAAFGPLVLLSLYSSRLTATGACFGIATGGLVTALWPYLDRDIPPLIPGFILSALVIYVVSLLTAPAAEKAI